MRIKRDGKTLCIIPGTDMKASNVQQLRDAIIDVLADHQDVRQVILDAKGVDIVDSLGINLVIGLFRQADSESKQFEIVNAGPMFMKMASFFKLKTLFSISVEEDDE